MATGVLVVGVGPRHPAAAPPRPTDKAYTATVRLGAGHATDDAEGEIAGRAAGRRRSTRPPSRAAMAALTGEIDQVPSAVSAIKVDGRRAYQRVRAGEDGGARRRGR